MILPIVSAVAREVFSQTPRRLEEGALALGATRWEMIRMAVLPFGKSAVISGSMLGLGRALGETMAVAIILSVSGIVTFNLVSQENPTPIAANIALKFPESSGLDVNVLIASGLVLFGITLVVNMIARLIISRSNVQSMAAHVDRAPSENPRRHSIPPRASPSAAAVRGGTLPPWFLRAVAGGSALVASRDPARHGQLHHRPVVVLTAVIALPTAYIWSRIGEGRRQAMDRLVTLGIAPASARGAAAVLPPLHGGRPWDRGLDGSFFTESARGVIGAGGGAEHAIVGHAGDHRRRHPDLRADRDHGRDLPERVRRGGRLRKALTFFVDVMTGIPSIVAGLFAYALFALFLGPGIRLGIIGSVALSVLMIPIVIRSAEEILKIVPDHLREAAYALGTPKWKVVARIVLPTALAGLVTGVMLAVARVIGETAPLLVTTGVIDSVNCNPLRGGCRTSPSTPTTSTRTRESTSRPPTTRPGPRR